MPPKSEDTGDTKTWTPGLEAVATSNGGATEMTPWVPWVVPIEAISTYNAAY